jgi:hypothetical protein
MLKVFSIPLKYKILFFVFLILICRATSIGMFISNLKP